MHFDSMDGLKLSSAFGTWLFRFLDDDGFGFVCARCFGFVGSRVDILFFITDGFKMLLDETEFVCLGFWNRNIELEYRHRVGCSGFPSIFLSVLTQVVFMCSSIATMLYMFLASSAFIPMILRHLF